MKMSTSLERVSALLTRAMSLSNAHIVTRTVPSHATGSSSISVPNHTAAKNTATDAANFSRLGACLTALPVDEKYILPNLLACPITRHVSMIHPSHLKTSNNAKAEVEAEAQRKMRREVHLRWYRGVSEIRYDQCTTAAKAD
ncbi:uncharacterized protein LY89DRAFT_170525 [Mollisia scopiformis]|uniref:Uncharacterized protein n=1 Tax=Mollisia scopiformis TaxID=149040 RepID=A0A194XT22_MOLSC|nr:uncharacterized protein LY89DRAFT_170525 [Mollisia scopiformis]KUJ23194.1 hypothetical protein LY89DRAFT_170525 [Mollisia scopiformis]